MSLILTPLASDNFQRANESPLASPPWSAPVGFFSGYGLQIINNLCELQTAGPYNSGIEFYTGASAPNDQYCSARLTNLSAGWVPLITGLLALGVRTVGPVNNLFLGTGYYAQLSNQGSGWGASSNGYASLTVVINDSYDGPLDADISGFQMNPNDVYVWAVVGTKLYFLQNGIELWSGTDTTLSSGQPALGGAAAVLSDFQVSNFAMGRASISAGPTKGTILGQYPNIGGNSNPVQGAFPQNHRRQDDLLQITTPNGGLVVWKMDYTGAVSVNPSSWTKNTVLGQRRGASWADAFQLNNANPYNFDVLQIVDEGGGVVWYLDSQGNVYSAS
jgi:hypothetical protein